MPRNGSGIYFRPPGIDGIPDHSIESAKYNLNVADVETDLNTVRPIVAGGTGATNAHDALVALHGEETGQAITNYDSATFFSGSFYSAPGATAAPPESGAWFSGICYTTSSPVGDFYIEARSLSSDLKYHRRKASGVWQAWVRDDQASTDFANTKVAKAGDTMSGPLVINAALTANSTVAVGASLTVGGNAQITGSVASIAGTYVFNAAGTSYMQFDGTNYVLNGGASLLATAAITSNLNIQAKGGNYYFQDATKYLQWTGATNGFVFQGGPLQVNNSIVTVGGSVHSATDVQAQGGFYYFQDGAKYLQWSGATSGFVFQGGGLQVNGTFIATGAISSGFGYYGKAGASGAAEAYNHNFFWSGTANQQWIDNTNTGNVSVTCDYRIKKDVVPLSSTWEAVRALKPIEYTQAEFTPPIEKVAYAKKVAAAHDKEAVPPLEPLFLASDIKQWGFIAHELQETLLPSAATGTKDAIAIVQSPNWLPIVAALTKALQEAMERIEELELRVGP